MKKIVFIGFTLMLSSCATVLNSREKHVEVITTSSAKVIVDNDTLSNIGNSTNLKVVRKAEPLLLTIYNDSISKTICINSSNSFAYWLNAYPSPLLWTGFLIDKKNPKRYTYPNRIYVNPADTTVEFNLYDAQSRKGQICLQYSFPYINNFVFKPENEGYIANTGFIGVTLGLDFFYSSRNFVSITVSGVTDFFVPFPGAVDFSGYHETMSSAFVGLSNNYKIKNLLLGYGLSYSRNTWQLHYYDSFDPPPQTRDPVTKTNNAIGFIFPLYYQYGKHFFAGLIYRPTVLRLNSATPIQYEHLIIIDFGWKIRIKK